MAEDKTNADLLYEFIYSFIKQNDMRVEEVIGIVEVVKFEPLNAALETTREDDEQ